MKILCDGGPCPYEPLVKIGFALSCATSVAFLVWAFLFLCAIGPYVLATLYHLDNTNQVSRYRLRPLTRRR